MSDKLLVKYTGNADLFSATQAITLEGRAPLVLNGAEGEVTAEEYATLIGRGVVLEKVGDGYDDLSAKDIKSRLDDAGVEYRGNASKDELVSLLRESQSGAGEIPPPAAVGSGGPAGGTAGDASPGATGTAAGSASVGVGQVTGGGAA